MELMWPSDNLAEAQAKMQEYVENGVQLGWLFNRVVKQVEIYRPVQPTEVLRRQVSSWAAPPCPILSLA